MRLSSYIDALPDPLLALVGRYAAAHARTERVSADGLRALSQTHKRARKVADWTASLRDAGFDVFNCPPASLPRLWARLRAANMPWSRRPRRLDGGSALLTLDVATEATTGPDARDRVFAGCHLRVEVADGRTAHCDTFWLAGDEWELRLERRGDKRARLAAHGNYLFPVRMQFADDRDLCVSVVKLPEEACRPSCNCAHDVRLRLSVLDEGSGRWLNASLDLAGCWCSVDVGPEWRALYERIDASRLQLRDAHRVTIRDPELDLDRDDLDRHFHDRFFRVCALVVAADGGEPDPY